MTAAAPLTLAGQADDTWLLVSLTNVSTAPVAIWWEVQGPDGPLYDCLTVELAGAGPTGRCCSPVTGTPRPAGWTVLDPGAGRSATLDLAAWSRAPINGGGALRTG